jgi:hypothetical protein
MVVQPMSSKTAGSINIGKTLVYRNRIDDNTRILIRHAIYANNHS